MGIVKNDIITVCVYNTTYSCLPYLATLYNGAIFSAVNPESSVNEATHILNILKPRMVITELEPLEVVETALKNAGIESKIVVFGETEKYVSFSSLLTHTGTEDSYQAVAVDVHDTAIISFSSGTSGLPKGISITHYGLMSKTIKELPKAFKYVYS